MNAAVKIDHGVAVITGAASGIGAGLARYAASRNMKLVLADWDEQGLDQLKSSLSTEVLAIKVDVRDAEKMQQLASAAFERFGHVDMLFNNAGILTSGRTWEIDASEWQRCLDVNIGGITNGLRAFIPRLIASDRPAHIINTASVGGFYTGALIAPYCASKAAVVAITESLAIELANIESKIRVSLLAPGPVKTSLMDAPVPTEFLRSLKAMADRNGKTPDEFAPIVFDAIERDQFWIIPQPESLDNKLQEQTEMILQRRHPADERGAGNE